MLFQGVEMPGVTDQELAVLELCASEDEWAIACTAIKEVRGGYYPPDWLDKVERSGLQRRVMARWCRSCG